MGQAKRLTTIMVAEGRWHEDVFGGVPSVGGAARAKQDAEVLKESCHDLNHFFSVATVARVSIRKANTSD